LPRPLVGAVPEHRVALSRGRGLSQLEFVMP